MIIRDLKIRLGTGVVKPGKMFLENIDLFVDYEKMRDDYLEVMSHALPNGWDDDAILNSMQINLRGSEFFPNPLPYDGRRGLSLYEKMNNDVTGEKIEKEMKEWYETASKSFLFWHDKIPEYTRQIIEKLAEQEKIEPLLRVRYLCQGPGRGLTIHKDPRVRYHFVIETNPGALFFNVLDCGPTVEHNLCPYHLPVANHFVKVDTTQQHFVYNAGTLPRIHLVIS